MNSFVYSEPVKVYFGVNKLAELQEILKELELTKVVIVCGKHFEEQAKSMMNNFTCICAYFAEVKPNPQLSGVIEVVKIARENKADTIIGIGGGSVIDTAKFAAAITYGEEEALTYYQGNKPFPNKRLSVVAIPTTAGTGSEVTQVSVISNGKEKRTINNPAFMPLAAIVDPSLSLSVSPKTTMITGLDALAHALEGYWSKNHQPISDLVAIEAVRIILNNLEKAYRNGNDIEVRANMAYASLLGGMSFAWPKTAACHACSYPLSEDYHLPHGEACAFTLDSFVRINADERLEHLAKSCGLSGTDELAKRINDFKKMAGLKLCLSELTNVDMDKLVHDCAIHGLMNNNPIKLSEADLRTMFEGLA